MKEQNIDNEFLNNFLKNKGIPKWNNILIQKKAKQTLNSTVSNSSAVFDTIVIVPFVKVNEYRVNGFLKIKITDSIRYNYSLAQDYKNYPYNINQEGLSAESFTTLILNLDNKVFGYKKFLIKDSLLFRNNNISSSQEISLLLEDSTTPNLQQNLNTISECTGTTIFITWNCNSTITQNITNPHCGVSFQFNNCLVTGVDWTGVWGGGVPSGSGSSGGGSGGGGFIPYNFPCNPTLLIANNINEPPGGSGNPLPPCPLPPTGIGWVPVLNQNQLDQIWMTQFVKDSTNNPCDSLVLATIRNMDTSLPRLFRNVFGSNGQINATINTTNQGATQGASTVEDLLNPTKFTISLNSYFSNASTLSKAASLLHESLHANLMFLFQKAVRENDVLYQNQIINDFKLFFDSVRVTSNSNLNYTTMMNQGQIGQHQIMALQNARFSLANALFNFAKKLDPNTLVDLNYCKKLAWTGTFDSRGYKRLPLFEKDEIEDIVNGERGNSVNQSTFSQIGKPCL